MRKFDYNDKWENLLTPEIVAQLTAIHEFKGEQNLFIEAKSDTLNSLLEIAKIQSTEASNKIEGIYTSDERLKNLVLNKTMPRTRGEQEIAGYRDVLATIHDSYEFIPVRPSIILQLHRDLYKFSGKSIGGAYKNSDNMGLYINRLPVLLCSSPVPFCSMSENDIFLSLYFFGMIYY